MRRSYDKQWLVLGTFLAVGIPIAVFLVGLVVFINYRRKNHNIPLFHDDHSVTSRSHSDAGIGLSWMASGYKRAIIKTFRYAGSGLPVYLTRVRRSLWPDFHRQTQPEDLAERGSIDVKGLEGNMDTAVISGATMDALNLATQTVRRRGSSKGSSQIASYLQDLSDLQHMARSALENIVLSRDENEQFRSPNAESDLEAAYATYPNTTSKVKGRLVIPDRRGHSMPAMSFLTFEHASPAGRRQISQDSLDHDLLKSLDPNVVTHINQSHNLVQQKNSTILTPSRHTDHDHRFVSPLSDITSSEAPDPPHSESSGNPPELGEIGRDFSWDLQRRSTLDIGRVDRGTEVAERKTLQDYEAESVLDSMSIFREGSQSSVSVYYDSWGNVIPSSSLSTISGPKHCLTATIMSHNDFRKLSPTVMPPKPMATSKSIANKDINVRRARFPPYSIMRRHSTSSDLPNYEALWPSVDEDPYHQRKPPTPQRSQKARYKSPLPAAAIVTADGTSDVLNVPRKRPSSPNKPPFAGKASSSEDKEPDMIFTIDDLPSASRPRSAKSHFNDPFGNTLPRRKELTLKPVAHGPLTKKLHRQDTPALEHCPSVTKALADDDTLRKRSESAPPEPASLGSERKKLRRVGKEGVAQVDNRKTTENIDKSWSQWSRIADWEGLQSKGVAKGVAGRGTEDSVEAFLRGTNMGNLGVGDLGIGRKTEMQHIVPSTPVGFLFDGEIVGDVGN